MAQGESKLTLVRSSDQNEQKWRWLLLQLFVAVLLFVTVPLYAQPGLIEPLSIAPCEAPLVMHLRRAGSEYEQVVTESFELCGIATQEDIPARQDIEPEMQRYKDPFAPGLKLQLTRTDTGVRVQLALADWHAQAISLVSNAPEQVLQWQPQTGSQVNPTVPLPTLRVRVERGIAGAGLARQFKIHTLNQPVAKVVRKLIEVGQLNVSGLELLCDQTITLNFEAIPAGSALALVADACDLSMRTPTNGRYLRFVHAKVNPVAKPTFASREAELKYIVLLEQQGLAERFSAQDALFELAELALKQHEYAPARGYLSALRKLPQSWFGASDTSIDIALARLEAKAGRFERALQLIDKTLNTLDQQDTDQISEERADALIIRAQICADKGLHAQAIKVARATLAMHEQLPYFEWDDRDYRERQKSLLRLLEESKMPTTK